MPALVLGGLVGASILALGLAFFVQYGLGYAPCPLCVLARWPHVAVIAIGVVALLSGAERAGLLLAMFALLVAFAISLRHAGVEAGSLALPGACAGVAPASDLDGLRSAILLQNQPSCGVPGPSVLGLSMAVWHALGALGLATIAATGLMVARGRRS